MAIPLSSTPLPSVPATAMFASQVFGVSDVRSGIVMSEPGAVGQFTITINATGDFFFTRGTRGIFVDLTINGTVVETITGAISRNPSGIAFPVTLTARVNTTRTRNLNLNDRVSFSIRVSADFSSGSLTASLGIASVS